MHIYFQCWGHGSSDKTWWRTKVWPHSAMVSEASARQLCVQQSPRYSSRRCWPMQEHCSVRKWGQGDSLVCTKIEEKQHFISVQHWQNTNSLINRRKKMKRTTKQQQTPIPHPSTHPKNNQAVSWNEENMKTSDTYYKKERKKKRFVRSWTKKFKAKQT